MAVTTEKCTDMNGVKPASLVEHQQALYAGLEEFDRVCRALGIRYFLFAGTMLGAVRHQGFIPWDDDVDVLMLRQDYDRFLREAENVLDQKRFYLQKEFSEHWPMFFSKLRLNGTACLEKYHPKDRKTHRGVYLDIFPCDNAYDSAILRKVQFLASKVVITKALFARGYETDSAVKKLVLQLCRLLPAKPFRALCRADKAGDTGFVHVFLGASSKYGRSVFPRSWFEETVELPFGEKRFPVPKEYDPVLTRLYGDYMTLPPEEDRSCKVHAVLVDLEHSYEEYEHYLDNMVFTEYTRSIR